MGRGTNASKAPRAGAKKPQRRQRPATVESVLDAVLDPVSRLDSKVKDRIVELWQQGATSQQIAAALNEEGFRAPTGRWWPRMVEGELKLVLADRGLAQVSASDSLATILARKLGRETIDQVAASLNASGIKPASGRWTPTKVMQALEQARSSEAPDSAAYAEIDKALLKQAKRKAQAAKSV